MQITRSRIRCLATTIPIAVVVLVWVLSCAYVATAGTYGDSAHGDDTSGVFRQPVSVELPLGLDCTLWPG